MKKLIFLLITFALLTGCQKYSAGEPVNKDEKPKQEKKEEKPKTLKEEVTASIYKSMEKETFKGADRIVNIELVKLDEEGNSIANIDLNADERGSVERAKRDMHENAKKLFPSLFKEEKINEVAIIWHLPLVDTKGNEEQHKVMKIRIKRENNINWDNFDINNFDIVSDQYWIHQALKE